MLIKRCAERQASRVPVPPHTASNSMSSGPHRHALAWVLISYCCCNQLTQIDLHIHMHTILFSYSFIDQKSYVDLTGRKWRLGQSCAPFGDSEDNSFPCLFWFQKASHSPFSSLPLQSQEETATKISLTLTTASRSHICNCQKPLDGTTPKANTKWWTLGSNWSRQVISCSFQTSTPEGDADGLSKTILICKLGGWELSVPQLFWEPENFKTIKIFFQVI